MSRGFVKEDDQEEVPIVPQRANAKLQLLNGRNNTGSGRGGLPGIDI